jgi:hypothetical protein
MQHVIENPKVKELIKKSDEYLKVIGYTEHGFRHAKLVASIALNILKILEYPVREQKLAEIAGYLHDIGNVINRHEHAQSGALIVYDILQEMNFKIDDVADICSAIGNHHEEDGDPVSNITAAVIIADKADVHKSRVRNKNQINFDIHDRVNYAVEESFVNVLPLDKKIVLKLKIDTKISSPLEYFEIFLDRMMLAKKAAEYLNCHFELVINGNSMG